MAKFKLADIKQAFEAEKWTLLSEEYKNLDGELQALCPNNHKVITTFKKWRKLHHCPICAENPGVALEQYKVGKKTKGKIRILAIDDATETSGWCLYDDKDLIAAGLLHFGQDDTTARIAAFRHWLLSVIELWQPDKVAIEDIQLQEYTNAKTHKKGSNVKTYKALAHLQGVELNVLFEKKIEAVVVHSSTWRSYCGITATTRSDMKRAARIKVMNWYNRDVSEDVAEAICIGKYVAEKFIRNNQMISWGEEL